VQIASQISGWEELNILDFRFWILGHIFGALEAQIIAYA
jgi:hypothetical protein